MGVSFLSSKILASCQEIKGSFIHDTRGSHNRVGRGSTFRHKRRERTGGVADSLLSFDVERFEDDHYIPRALTAL